MTNRWLMHAIACGVAAGVVYTLSPLGLVLAAVIVVVFRSVGSRLEEPERRWLRALVFVAMTLRVLAIVVLFLVTPHDDQSSAILFGDEAYTHARAIRFRNIATGVPSQRVDYGQAFEDYGTNAYNTLVADAYLVFGPSPYGLRLLSSLVSVLAALLLFHMVRRSYGPVTAFGGLAVLLFLPTQFMWSIAMLKEPFIFAATVLALWAMAVVLGSARTRSQVAAVLVVLATIWALIGFRPESAVIMPVSIALAVVILLASRSPIRLVTTGLVAAVMVAGVLTYPPAQKRVRTAVEIGARRHRGHVFTVGHSYRLLDDWFYLQPRITDTVPLTPPEAARFLVRGIASFVTVPFPWTIATRGELVLLPEQLVWYGLVALLPLGLWTGFRRDPVLTSLLLAHGLVAAAAVAFTNGNVGTLVRFRGLVVPYWIWISALGGTVLLDRLAEYQRDSAIARTFAK